MTGRPEWPELGGADALDAAIPPVPVRALPWFPWLRPLRTRAALGMPPAVAPAVLFVPIGVLLGPSFANVLSPTVLGYLQAVVAVALAVLGVSAGLGLNLKGERDRTLFAAASVQALVTLVVVGGAFRYLLTAWQMPIALPYDLVALTLGLCVSVSSAVSPDGATPTRALAVRIAYLDDFLPIVISGLVVVMLGSTTPLPFGEAVGWLMQTVLLGGAVALSGWLLFGRSNSRAERNVFIAGIVALLGGTTTFLGLSPLLAGLTAGLIWVKLPGQAEAVVRSDLQRVQHPLIVVLLLVAGASCEFSRQAAWLTAPLVLFRLTGKLMGSWLAARVQGLVTASEIGMHVMAPGLLGIAVALYLLHVVRTPAMSTVLTAVVVSTLVSEALALVVRPVERPRS